MTVDELIAEVDRRGLRLANLFQLTDGRWQSNVTDGERYWEFGRADTAVGALLAALHIASTTEPELGIQQTNKVYNQPRQKVSDDQAAEMLKGLI